MALEGIRIWLWALGRAQRGVQARWDAGMEDKERSRQGCREDGMRLWSIGRGAERGAGKMGCGHGT